MGRWLRHLFSFMAHTRVLFPPPLLSQIESDIAAAEARHAGQIRFVIETSLPFLALWHGVTPRERALQLFAQLHIWDTQANNGVLIYVLRADRAVEIIADRGINVAVKGAEWDLICREVERQFRAGQYALGSRAAIDGVARLLGRHFPAGPSVAGDELPNQPILL